MMLGDLSLYGWLAGIVGALVAALAVKSRNQYRDKAKQSESRTGAVIEKRKLDHEIEKMLDDLVAAEFDRLRDSKVKRGR